MYKGEAVKRHDQQEATLIAIQEFDPRHATPSDWAAYHRYRRLRAAEDTPDLPVANDAAAQRSLATASPLQEWRIFTAVRDGEVVGDLTGWWRREGTANYERFAPLIHVRGGVLVACRRQGIGSALLARLLSLMEERCKRAATLETHDDASARFLVARSAVEKFRGVENRLAMADVQWSALQRLQESDTGPLHWETHAGRVPTERLRALLPTLAQLIADVPLGTLDVPPTPPDLPHYEASYKRMDERGGCHLLVLAMAGGAVVAVCETMWSADTPTYATQTFTGVAREWRGQGLARQAKARMLAVIARELPQVTHVNTHNAETNVPMLRVNMALGFQPWRQLRILQVEREQLAQALARPRANDGPA